MAEKLQLDGYKQRVADIYTRRSHNYDESKFHQQIAAHLVEFANIQWGETILDIATGTGLVAIAAAQIVEDRGRVVAIDISTGMLQQAESKIKAIGLHNIEFLQADAEDLDFPENTFDVILCSAAITWLLDIPTALRQWYKLLKPGGRLGFHAFADTAFVGGVAMKEAAASYGVTLTYNDITGNPQKCYQLLEEAGFQKIEIIAEQYGDFIALEAAKQMWIDPASFQPPGQLHNPLSQLSAVELARMKNEFNAKLESLLTDKGIWNDILIFYALGRK